jgi:LPS-assembly protein
VTKLFNCQSAKFSLCLAFLLALTFQPDFLQAEKVKTDEWQIEADKVLRFEDPPSVIAEGNVVLTKLRILPPKQEDKKARLSGWGLLLEEEPVAEETDMVTQEVTLNEEPRLITQMTVKADWVAYDVEQNSIKAKGNVAIFSDTDQLHAKEGVLNLGNETGTFKEATILREKLELHLEGETIKKTGSNTYHIENGWVVTCKVEKGNTPPWSFAASDTKVTQGGYATMKHATFRIKDVPVLYTPWLMVPVGNKRMTGVLFPELSISDRGGFGINLPLYINLSDSSDITLYPEYYTNRGFMPGFEYRYVLDPQKKGSLMASYLDDDLSDPSETDYWKDTGYTHTNQERYWVRGKLDHDFENEIVTRLDLDMVSDRDYLTEFNSGVTGFQESNDRALEIFGRGFQNKTNDKRVNSMKVLKYWDGMALEGVFLGINDVRKSKSSPTPLWKLPSLDFTGSRNIGESDISFDWDTDYVNYYREDGVGGHRFDLYPRLSAPLPLGAYVEARVEAGIRDTYYNIQTFGDGEWDGDDSQNRLLGDFHTEIGTTLLRDFTSNAEETEGLTHNFRPYIQYDYLSDTNQDDLPDFDSVDRKDHRNEITYGIDNFFTLFGRSKSGKETEYDYGYLKLEQSYDLRSEESDSPFSPVNIKLNWTPTEKTSLIYKTDIDVYGAGFTTHTVEGRYKNSRGDYLNLDYRFDEEDNTEQINVGARAQLYDTIFAEYGIEHSLSEDNVIEQNISLLYQPACWSVELKSQYTPGDHTISVLFNLANIGSGLGLNL